MILCVDAALCVVGNKCDLSDQREISRDRGEKFAHQLGAMFSETSAATSTGRLRIRAGVS